MTWQENPQYLGSCSAEVPLLGIDLCPLRFVRPTPSTLEYDLIWKVGKCGYN